MGERFVRAGQVRLAVEDSAVEPTGAHPHRPAVQVGSGVSPPVVLLHGLTATRRYVVMGSTALQRAGHRVIACDARGHGRSAPALRPEAYGYDDLVRDLEAVLDIVALPRAVLVGASMGAHTALAFALAHPERVAGLVVITPAFDPAPEPEAARAARLARWDALAVGLRSGGIDGFLAAYGQPATSPRYAKTVIEVIRQRLAEHQHPEAVADALEAVPRSRPFERLEQLSAVRVPAAVVASGDEADPGHPRRVGEAYARTMPGARLITDEPGSSPVAWRGNRLSEVIREVAGAAIEL